MQHLSVIFVVVSILYLVEGAKRTVPPPTGWKTCIAKGDPHYTTFDGYEFEFSGHCSYVLTSDCTSHRTNKRFVVKATNMVLGKTARVIQVNVEVAGYNIELCEGKTMKVDGVLIENPYFPYDVNQGHEVIIHLEGEYLILMADGIHVHWDGAWHVEVDIDPEPIHKGIETLCGMCGNANGINAYYDDLVTYAGLTIKDDSPIEIARFADSWVVPKSCVSI
ncbi:BMP-binding endothelial regulator protein-like [Saccoglossus kowalevskii]|uniref:von Willebrand type d domain protein-m1 n=1 Tax=Saccoglossus kowalevskii TaxID=10224 RepID=A0A0U2UDE2_SACKO|nr:von Willebrand type d domain protein-m1 [Saccoglossus kowalevskii]